MGKHELLGSSSSAKTNWQVAQADRVRAAIAAAGRAVDAEDAAELLAMLGLLTPSDGLQQDPHCPSRQAHAALRLRRAAGHPGPKTATPDPGAPRG